ncbi:DUF3515 domain-containing protein [Kribbella sp. NPDC048915]|uniref:DUF3515 domain-containing protein n=1 Tax=Kribbella sp. NPDC048915 TaxID=3155148 RepID=UPI0033E5D177
MPKSRPFNSADPIPGRQHTGPQHTGPRHADPHRARARRIGLRSWGLGVVGVLLLVSACSPGPAAVPVPSPAPEVAAACAGLVQALPGKILDAERRETSPKSPLTAAYGDPPIELTCGVSPPAGMAEAETKCFEVNGVGWFAKEVQNGVVFTTIGRALYFEVAVPSKYAPEANALVDVSDAVHKHNKLVTPCT